jgi:ABC-type glycerol-3-phosphate transport system permease component
LGGTQAPLTILAFNYTLNSFIIAGVVTVSNTFLASLGGYAFARLRFPGREVLFCLVLGTLMIPDQLRLVPIYVMLVGEEREFSVDRDKVFLFDKETQERVRV